MKRHTPEEISYDIQMGYRNEDTTLTWSGWSMGGVEHTETYRVDVAISFENEAYHVKGWIDYHQLKSIHIMKSFGTPEAARQYVRELVGEFD